MGSLNEAKTVKTLPKGKYTLVGVDIDTTGKRLIDEIVQLAAYTPNSHFEQYIMPYMNLNPAATNRHQVRVITIGFYRMLKSLQTFKVIKSKSEVAALKDFLNWLELLKKNNPDSDGIIMIYHEERKFIPYMILEALKKYDLLERFQQTVKAFTNGFHLAQKNNAITNEDGPTQYLSLRKLARALSEVGDKNNNNEEQVSSTSSPKMEKAGDASVSPKTENKKQRRNRRRSNSESDLFDGSASIRAKLTYNVALRLTNNNNNNNNYGKATEAENMHEIITQYAQPISCDLDELESQNLMLDRQNSFRPVFLNYFKATLQHRLRAVKYRIILAENGHDLNSLNTIWTEKQKEGLAEVIQAIEDLKQEDKIDLIDLFDSFYDPTKTTIKPVIKSNRRAPRRSGRNKVNQAGGDSNHSAVDKKMQPDSTTKDGTVRRTPRSRRGPRSRNSSYANSNGVNTSPATVNTTVSTPVSTPVIIPVATFVSPAVPEIAQVPVVINL